MNPRRRQFAIVLAAPVLLFGAACQNQRVTSPPPHGDTGGRTDPYRSTGADRYSPEISSVTLLEFSDQVADALAARIGTIPEINGAEPRVVIEMGEIENRTYTPSNDFIIARRRIFTGLVNSNVSNYADILEAPEVVDSQRDRFADDGADADRYDTRGTYLLQGFFGETARGEGVQSTYYSEITLTNLQSRRIVFVEQLDSKQFR